MTIGQRVDPPLPGWVQSIRDHQETAVEQIVQAFEEVPVVFVDGPTGTGKTLIAELVRRRIGGACLYVCSDKTLQDQFARDFPYAKVLKGRGNYPTELDPRHMCDDCTSTAPEMPCWFCNSKGSCPYEQAKREALRAPLAVTNTAYLLYEANFVGKFSGRDLIVADEADTLEKMLMGFVEFIVPARTMRKLGMEAPIKAARKPTLIAWLQELARNAHNAAQMTTDAKEFRRMMSLSDDAMRVRQELEREVARKAEGESDGKWLRDYDSRDDTLILKPVAVDSYGTRRLWRHAQRWLVMSATLISSDEMSDSLGLPFDYRTVTVPMTFPVENRKIVMAPVANVVYKEMDKAVPQLVHAIGRVLEKHPDDSILVHTVSYKLAQQIQDGLRRNPATGGREIMTYTEGREREAVLARFKARRGAVMLAPSMSRGVDLPGDLCRVQVIAKVPFLSLGDRQVSARSHLPGGQMWYAVQAIREIVQMTGRAIRSADDWAVTYIFDRQFASNLWKQNKLLFPEWWRDAVDTGINIREFVS